MANYSPADDNTVLLYLPGQDQYPALFWKDTLKTDPVTTAGDLIRRVDNGFVGGGTNWRSYGDTTTNRPELGSDGGVQFSGALAGNGGNPTGLDIATSTAVLNALHNTGYADIGLMFKCNSGYGFKSRPMIDNTNINSTARGIFAGTVAADTSHAKFRFYMNNGSANLIDLTSAEWVEDNSWHRARIHIEPGDGLSWIQVDKSTRMYGSLNAASIVTGNAATNVYLGTRATIGASVTFEGQLKNVRIGTAWGSDSLANWELDSPLGTLTGDPELRGEEIHCSLNKTYYYCPRFIWFNGKLIADPTDTDGAVYAWDHSSGWQGSGHGAGAPPEGGETVLSTSVSVDGVAETFEDGGYYDGTHVSFTRRTSTVAFSEQLHTVTLAGNAKTDYIRMTRNGTAGSGGEPGIRSMYPIRNTRAPSFTAYLALDSDGEELASGVMGSGQVTLVGARAVAQFSSSLGVMALIVMTKGYDIPGFQHIILDVAQNKRIYQEIEDYQSNVSDTEGTQFEMASTTKFYETDSGSWEALAASEMLKIVNARRPVGGIGCRMGMGI